MKPSPKTACTPLNKAVQASRAASVVTVNEAARTFIPAGSAMAAVLEKLRPQ